MNTITVRYAATMISFAHMDRERAGHISATAQCMYLDLVIDGRHVRIEFRLMNDSVSMSARTTQRYRHAGIRLDDIEEAMGSPEWWLSMVSRIAEWYLEVSDDSDC